MGAEVNKVIKKHKDNATFGVNQSEQDTNQFLPRLSGQIGPNGKMQPNPQPRTGEFFSPFVRRG